MVVEPAAISDARDRVVGALGAQPPAATARPDISHETVEEPRLPAFERADNDTAVEKPVELLASGLGHEPAVVARS
jgi:hypothetical protein